jgi:enoyl-CoA hydratase
MTEYKFLKTRQVNTTLWVEIHNPPVNFLTADICEELFTLIKKIRKDPSIRVFILTGGIEDNYIMHFSIPELRKVPEDNRKILMNLIFRFRITGMLMKYFTTFSNWQMDWIPGYEKIMLLLAKAIRGYSSTLFLWFQMHRLYLAIERMPKVTIAAINGSCNGGGTEISACFDFRFMIDDQKFTIGQPECLLGIIPGGGGSQRLPRLIGKARALEFMLRGNQLTPEAAKDIGLITDNFEKAEFHEKIQLVADQMSRRIPIAVEGIKLAVHDGMETSFRHGLSVEMEQTIRCFSDPVTKRALDEYIEIIKENIEVPEDRRWHVNKVVEMLQSDEFSRKISN